MQLTDIENLAKAYADKHRVMSETLTAMQSELDQIERSYRAKLKTQAARLATTKLELGRAVDTNRELFETKRTQVFHGVKLGLQKGKGGIEISDPERSITLIRKHFSPIAPTLIVTKESVNKTNLAKLNVAELKKVGAHVVAATDKVVIKHTDSAIEKAVNAMLKDLVSELQEMEEVAA